MVATALEGAAARLSTAACRRVLDDFTDANGRTLSADLGATGLSLEAYLASLYYVEGDMTTECRERNLMAFTAPGSRVVHVCGDRFAKWWISPSVGEALLIHEVLHALGLGENPPSSESITAAVRRRCETGAPIEPGPAADVQFRAPIPSLPIRPQ